jgi:GNAT superfamily N-acetyltransferase
MLAAMTVTISEATTPGAMERLVALRNQVDPRVVTVDGYVTEQLGAIGLRNVLAIDDGDEVGAGTVLWREWGRENQTAGMGVWVLPDARRRGVGTALIEDLAAYARTAGMTSWLSNAVEDDPGSRAFARRIGFEEGPAGQAGYFDLTVDAPSTTAEAPDGFAISTYAERTDLARSVFDLEVLVAPEVPALRDEPPPSYEAWTSETADDPAFLRDLTLIAHIDDRVLGAIQTYDVGDRTVYIGMTSVHPESRRQGVASQLKTSLADRARAGGWRRLMTYNDGSNEAIRGLNERLGYTYLPRVVRLKGPIPSPDALRAS